MKNKTSLVLGTLALVGSVALVACGGSDDDEPAPTGNPGAGGAAAGSSGAGGAKAGAGGTAAGAGGSSAGSGGTAAGAGGSTAGSGGSAAGAGGSTAGSGGTAAGAGGSTAGSGGTAAGAGGSSAGSGGTAAGAGGSTAGSGGTAAGAGGAGGAGGAVVPADFSCVPVAGPDPKPASTTVTFDFYVTNYQDKKPISGYALKACKKDDAACATPLDSKTSDAAGKVTFTVTVDAAGPGFDGYIDATDPLMTTYYPTLYAWGNHAAIGQLAGGSTWGVSVFPKALFGAATAMGGVTVDAADGHVLHVTRDCKWASASGVAVTPSAGADGAKTVTRYTQGAGLSKTATVTSDSGASFVFNLLAGNATIDARVPSGSGAPDLVLGAVTVPVRPGVLTVTSWYPKPIPAL